MKSKCTAFTAALLCFVLFANTQTIEKGRNFINGSISFNKQSNKPVNNMYNSTTTSDGKGALFNIKYGKFISDNSILGVLGIYRLRKG